MPKYSMSIIRWNPWSLDRFFDEDFSFPTIPALNRVLDQGLNLYETDDAIVAEVAVPGIPEDRIDVSVDEDGIVRITASYEDKQEDRSKWNVKTEVYKAAKTSPQKDQSLK